MKKNNFNLLMTIILAITFFSSKASSLPDKDSLPSMPVKNQMAVFHGSDDLQVSTTQKDENTKGINGFIFSAVVTPKFETTIPPVNLYFEHGIAGLASGGVSFGVLYDHPSDVDFKITTLSFGVRGCGYVFPIISKISGKENKQYGFQPYAGFVFDYFTTTVFGGNEDVGSITSSKLGVCLGTRWYPGKGKLGLLGEFNSNGLGNNFRFGISLGR